MKDIDYFIPTRVIFGAGRLAELGRAELPGKKALVCIGAGGHVRKCGLLDKVLGLLRGNGAAAAVYDGITPNPTRREVMEARNLGKKEGCDFLLGLGGGSSIDAAKAVAVVMANPGDLWDYASAGSGGRKKVAGALPVVAVATTAGTGTETDPYSVITNEETGEKLDFTLDAVFPRLSVIDPELMASLPAGLTLYQGFDALFHASECYVNNGGRNRLLDLYAVDAVDILTRSLPKVLADGGDVDARGDIAYAANILGGFTQALGPCTSHHILAQALGGRFPAVPHGAALIALALQYYGRVHSLLPREFDAVGGVMGEKADPADPGGAFVRGLAKLMRATGADKLSLENLGVDRAGLAEVADTAANKVGFSCDRYTLTEKDALEILEKSY